MSNIRRQSIISSVIIYFGFALGILNTYLFVKEGGFTKEQYGLTGTFIALGQIMLSIAAMGMPSFLYKFHPYYKDNLPINKNEQLTLALIVSCLGFLLVLAGGFVFKGLINKIYANSPDIIKYYYWIFPFGFGLTIFSILEAYGWSIHKSIITNFLKEVLFRFMVTLLFTLTVFGIITNFDGFIKLYSFAYLFISLIFLGYLIGKGKVKLVLSISRVTKKFRKKIVALIAFVWSGGLIYTLASVFDTIVLTAVMPNGLAVAALFTLAQNICSLIQAPQRGIISASVGPLSQAWKNKDFNKIKRIYQRSSINQLIFAAGMFCLVWLNFFDGIDTFGLQQDYAYAFQVFILLGLVRIIDMGTGVNAQIIGTSTYWRFEFKAGLVLLALALPLNYLLTKEIGLMGPPISNLIAFTVYNYIRFLFLWRKFNMQPFTWKSLYTILLAVFCFIVCWFLFNDKKGIEWIVLRSGLFMLLYGTGMVYLDLSPDLKAVLQTLKKRIGIRIKE